MQPGTKAERSLALGLLVVLVGLAWGLGPRHKAPAAGPFSGTAEVVDGDSLRIGGRDVRLQGIDAPEYRQTCRRDGRPEACGHQAREALAALIGGRRVACRADGSDRFERTLAVCEAGGLELNRQMVVQGHAVAFGAYEAEEDEARRARRGIWATSFERPSDWRAQHPRDP